MIEKPILSAKIEDTSILRFPLLGTPKFDGIRCCIINGKALTRSLKPIPNLFIRKQIENVAIEGFDGEIMPKVDLFNKVQSAVMSRDGAPEFTYFVFDLVNNPNESYNIRTIKLEQCPLLPNIEHVIPILIRNEEELLSYEIKCLKDGFEGVMLRTPGSPYKFGRSTLKQQYLMKLKRFDDAEAIVIGTFEQESNQNTAITDALGHTKRSSHQENKVPMNTLGGFTVKDLNTNVIFNVGTGRGLTKELRKEIWNKKETYIGKILKYKFQAYGTLNAPRSPIFIGFRDIKDM